MLLLWLCPNPNPNPDPDPNPNQVNVQGIVLAGSADFKNDLAQSDIFDQRLVAKVLKTVDVSYGGENGVNQAIELSSNPNPNPTPTPNLTLPSDH